MGLPSEAAPIFWLSLLAIALLVASIVALSVVNKFFQRGKSYSRIYSVAAMTGVFGLWLLAVASTFQTAAVAILLIGGVAMSVMRTVSVVWANNNASNGVRATVQSFLSLAENVGEVTLGFCLAIIASYAGIPAAMVGSSVFLMGVVLLVESRSKSS